MKKKLIIIGAVIGVIFIVAIAATFIFLDSIVKKGVETVGPQITKTEVKLGKVSLSPFSGAGKLGDFVLGNPEGCKTPTAIAVGEIKVAVDIGSLTKDVMVVKEVSIIAPELTYEGGLGGNNFSKILANVEAATGGGDKSADKSKESQSADKSQKKIKIQDLTIKGAKVNLVITGMGGKAITLPMADIHLQNIGNDMDGVTIAEATKLIFSEITKGVGKVAAEAASNVGKMGKDAAAEATKSLDKTTKSIKGLFGK
jgi:uncharacterized protein involved in outer membrane biogenesis